MSGPGTITVASTGSITAPSSITVSLASKLSTLLDRLATVDVIALPSARTVMISNGVNFQYALLDGAMYLNGPLAPYAAPTVASTAVSAFSTLTATAFANNDELTIGTPSPPLNSVNILSTLNTALYQVQVKRTGTLLTDITNLYKLLTGTGTNGSEYWDGINVTERGFYDTNWWREVMGVTASAPTTSDGGITYTMVVTAAASGISGNSLRATKVTGAGLAFTGTLLAGGTAGTGIAPGPGTFQYATANVRKADGAETAISNIATLNTDANANVTVSAYDAPNSRDGIDLYRIMRTTDTGDEKYPVGDDAASPFTDDVSDTTLVRDGNDPYDPAIVRSYAGGYPTRYAHHTTHLGSVFGAGALLHTKKNQGTANVVKWDYATSTAAASMAVTLSTGTPKENWIGRTFRVTDDDVRYGINGVNESTKVLTLNRPYEGATNATASYEVTDERDANAIYYTEPGLPNNWPYENSVEGISSDDPRGNMGLRSMWGALIAWSRTSAFRIQGDQSGGFTIPEKNEGAGAFGSSSIIKVTGSSGDSGALLWLGPAGVLMWDGSGAPFPISSPPNDGDDVTGIETTIQRINSLATRGIVSNYNPSSKIARWFVPVDGSLFNNFVINYNLQTRCFTFGACDAVTSAATIVNPGAGAQYITVVGDAYRCFWQLDVGYSDGAYGFECRQVITDYDTATNKASVTGTPFPTTSGGLTGVPVLLVSATGVVQHVTVGTNTSSTLTFAIPPDTAPAVGTQMIVGGIFWRMKSSKFNLGMPEIRKTLSSMLLQFSTSTAGQIWVAFSVNNSDPTCFVLIDGTTDYVDLTVAKGVKYCEANRGPGMVMQVDIFALAPGFDLELGAIEATVKTRDEVKR